MCQEQESVRDYEAQIRTKNSEIRYFLISSELMNVDGTLHLICVGKDITEKKHIEEALRFSRESFSKAFNSNPMAMTISTLEDGRLVNVNKSFCRIFGSNSSDVIGRKSLKIGFWADKNDRNFIKDKIMNNEIVHDKEITFYTNNGKKRIGLIYAERLDINGEGCMLSIIMDITERKDMEIEITRLDRLNLVGEMAASIGHEIRNPMTSVRGFLQMFGDKYSEDKEFLNLMIEELDRANAIISEFLSLAKNKMVKLKNQNINEILTNILPLVQANATIQDKSIKLEVEQVPDLFLDEKEIRQLTLNLVYNGLESMSAGKTITIKTYQDGQNVVLAIQDQGHGIGEEVAANLGTPFFTTKENGTGLGLAVCYGIAKRHNAKIDIETSSKGTTFYIRFPI
jgi:PAS domain S-box-containing protein